jgi:hypothetical protein
MTNNTNVINMYEFKRKQSNRLAQQNQPEKDSLQEMLINLDTAYRACEFMLVETKKILSKKPSWLYRMTMPGILKEAEKTYCEILIKMKEIQELGKEIQDHINFLT